jgi:hypothetical protein
VAIETNSKIDLISKALILAGEKPLTSLNDNRYGATVGSNLFEIIYENELQAGRWRFAMNKKALSQLVATPLNQWAYAYQLPSDMLLPIGVYPVDLRYEIYADKLYSDRTSVELDYMFKPNITDCPAYFAKLMTYALAKDMIKAITESDVAVEIMTKKYDQQRSIALYADAQGRPAKPAFHSPFTDVRY